MFRDALDYPTRAPTGGRVVLTGGALLLSVPVFGAFGGVVPALAPVALVGVLAWLLVRGYHVSVVRTTIGRSRPSPPEFDGYGTLLVDGLKATFITLTYLIPALVAVAVAVVVANAPTLTGSNAGTLALQIIAGLLAVVGVLYTIGALYALPVAVAVFAYTGRLRPAFDIRIVARGAISEDYAVAWFVSMLLQVFLVPFAYLLYPLLVGFFFRFHLSVGVRYCYGRGVGAALRLEALEPTAADPSMERPQNPTASAQRSDSSFVDRDPLEREVDR